MNKSILNIEAQDFIQQNLQTDITKLVLKGSPFKNISIQELAKQIIAKNKCKKKLPTWYDAKNIYYPDKLNIEQTSSEITAIYKAQLITGKSILDITGGFGVDCFAFSKYFKTVTHCEINTELSTIVAHNYKQLKVKNIQTIAKDGITYLTNNNKIYDCIYIDPSRRNELKKRVFLLADCTPDLSKNLDVLLKYSNTILIKTSPILDIQAAINELHSIKEIHIVAIQNEVKEVLYLIQKNYSKKPSYKTINITKSENQIFAFSPNITKANYSLPQQYLYEPNAAILKAGAFKEISNQLNISKLHKHSHLYTSDSEILFPGRVFKILQQTTYHPKKLKKFLQIEKANITTRNFPDNVATIRKKTKIKDGGTLYLFFTTNIHNEKIVLVCEKT